MNAEYLDILKEEGSLTNLFAALMGHKPRLTCLSQGRGPVDRLESHVLGVKPRNFAHIREITMGTNSVDWLFARTVIPLSTMIGKAARLKYANNIPLGKILFGSLNAVRSQMKIQLVTPDDVGLVLPEIADNFPLWQRQSVFELSTGPLMITEVLLPHCPIYNFAH